MLRTDYQSKHLHSLLTKLQINQESKEDMVYSFTNQRTVSTKEMTYYECRDMITEIEKMLQPENFAKVQNFGKVENENRDKKDFLQKERRKIFVLMYDCGFISNKDETPRKMQVINAWITKKMNLAKEFNELTIDELLVMNTQLQIVRRIYKEKTEKQKILN